MPRKPALPTPEIPQFALYGELQKAEGVELVHIETIQARSRLHDWHIARHTHRGLFQVLFLLSGTVRASVGEAAWQLDGPVALAIHPALVHGFDFSAEAQGYVLTIEENLVYTAGEAHGNLLAPLFLQPQPIGLAAQPELRARMVGLLEQLLAEVAWPQYGHVFMLERLACSVLVLLVRAQAEHRFASSTDPGDFELFSRFRSAVEQHYKTQWQVGQYAEALKIAPVRLNRLCVRLTGQTAFDIAQDRLMLEACRKLTYAPSSIASVCYELGFQDPAYFSRLFRKRIGVTPKAFRAQAEREPAA